VIKIKKTPTNTSLAYQRLRKALLKNQKAYIFTRNQRWPKKSRRFARSLGRGYSICFRKCKLDFSTLIIRGEKHDFTQIKK
jgi:hypothetical protein